MNIVRQWLILFCNSQLEVPEQFNISTQLELGAPAEVEPVWQNQLYYTITYFYTNSSYDVDCV